jgi:hypothetical protein
MSDIFNEVEQDLRREQLKKLWDRFGVAVIVVAIAVVAATAGWRGYLAWQQSKANESGDLFFSALELSQQEDHAGAAAALDGLAEEGQAGYRLLARFRAASEYAQAGDRPAALAAFDAIAADSSVTPLYRNLARVRAGYLALDDGDRAAVDERVAALAAGDGPWRQAAREIAGLAAYAAGDLTAAEGFFKQIADDRTASGEFGNRAQLMLALIQSAKPPAAKSAEDPS